MEKDVGETSKVGACQIGLVNSCGFGVSYRDPVGNNYGASFACDVFERSDAGVFAAQLLALLVINHSGDFRRGESDFNVPGGEPHGGGGENMFGNHGDWIAVVILGECNAEVYLHLPLNLWFILVLLTLLSYSQLHIPLTSMGMDDVEPDYLH